MGSLSEKRDLETNLKSIAGDDSEMKEQECGSRRCEFLKYPHEQQTTPMNLSIFTVTLNCSLVICLENGWHTCLLLHGTL